MSINKVSAIVLAGTVAIAGNSLLMATPALAVTPVSELKDVSPDHWAYNAIQTLVEKYQVMEGFPDKTFRGSKTVTRYELAAALARVMAKVEQRIAAANGGSVEVEPGVNPEDLRTIARLQREFREELDAQKARVDTIDTRLTAVEKRVRLSGSVRADYRDFVGASNLATQPWADFRVENAINLDATLMDNLTWSSQLNVDLYNPQSLGNPFLRGTANATAPGPNALTDVYLPKSILNYDGSWDHFAAGIGGIRDTLTFGSSLADPFRENTLWTNATGSYGFVGTPGWNPGGTSVATLRTPNGQAGAPVWLPGTNVIVDAFDPNGSQAFEPTGDILAADQATFGPIHVGLGVNRGALSSTYLMPGADPTVLPASIPAFATWQAGSVSYGTLGADWGMGHLNLAVNSPSDTLFVGGQYDKMLSAALDLGTDALSLSLEGLANSNFTFSQFAASKASVRLASMNIMDTGFGAALGLVTGSAVATPPVGIGASNAFATTNNLFGGTADYTSLGLMLKSPAIFVIPSFYLAIQNTAPGLAFAGFTGNTAASGLTLGTQFQVFGLPTLGLEYSQGKFNPGMNNALWNLSAPISSEQVTVSSQFKF